MTATRSHGDMSSPSTRRPSFSTSCASCSRRRATTSPPRTSRPTPSPRSKRSQPDALIIDIAIGQEAGWELLEQLDADADTAGIPVLVVSTDPRLLAHAEAHAARYGSHRFLEKPLDLEAMLTNIREMIGES